MLVEMCHLIPRVLFSAYGFLCAAEFYILRPLLASHLTLSFQNVWKMAWWSVINTEKASIPAWHCLCLISHKVNTSAVLVTWCLCCQPEVGA